LITNDDGTIEGFAAEEVEAMGRVTYFINRADADDESPVYEAVRTFIFYKHLGSDFAMVSGNGKV